LIALQTFSIVAYEGDDKVMPVMLSWPFLQIAGNLELNNTHALPQSIKKSESVDAIIWVRPLFALYAIAESAWNVATTKYINPDAFGRWSAVTSVCSLSTRSSVKN
jgi:hypothetical protein